MNDLEEIIRWNSQCADEPILNRARHLAEPRFIVLAFEDVNLGYRHLLSPLKDRDRRRTPLPSDLPNYAIVSSASAMP
jgi:hypothetical protein